MLKLEVGEAEQGMGWLEFIASVVGSVAWPIAAVAIAVLFRKQIAALLNKIRTLTLGDAVVDFSEKLDKVETAAETAPDLAEPAPLAPRPLHEVEELPPPWSQPSLVRWTRPEIASPGHGFRRFWRFPPQPPSWKPGCLSRAGSRNLAVDIRLKRDRTSATRARGVRSNASTWTRRSPTALSTSSKIYCN